MRKLSGALLEEDVVKDWDAYENALRRKVGRPDMADDVTEQPFNDLMSGLAGAKVTAAQAQYDSNVDILERRIRAAQPNEAVHANASPASLADLEADYRDDYNIPQTRPVEKDYWSEDTKTYETRTVDVPNPINPVLLQTKGFDHKGLGGAETPSSRKAAEELVDQNIMPEGLDEKIWVANSRRYMKSSMDKTQTATTLKDWLTQRDEFASTLYDASDAFKVTNSNQRSNPKLTPLSIIDRHLGHLDSDQVLSALFSAGMGGFRHERHTELSDDDKISMLLDEKEGEAFVSGEDFGRPRDFRITNQIGKLIDDNLSVKMPPAEKKILAAAVADAIAATPMVDIDKVYHQQGKVVGQDTLANGSKATVFYEYGDKANKSFARFEGFILEANPSLRVDLRTAPLPDQDYKDLTPFKNDLPGWDYGKDPERSNANEIMSKMGHLLDTKGLGFVSFVNSLRVANQKTVPAFTTNKEGRQVPYKRVDKDDWEGVFNKTGIQVMNPVFTQAKLLSEAGTNVFYQTPVRYLNGRDGYRESVNTKNNTLLRAFSLPIKAERIHLNNEEDVNNQKISIAKMLGGGGKTDEYALKWYDNNVSSVVPMGHAIQDIISQQASGTPHDQINTNVDPKELADMMTEKFDSVQALRAMSELESAFERRTLAKKRGGSARDVLDTFFVLEQDSTASGPSLIAQVVASADALQKTGLVPANANMNREMLIVGDEMHQANAEAAMDAYEVAFDSYETDEMQELEKFLIVAYEKEKDEPGDAVKRVFSRSMGKGFATPAFYGSSTLSAKRAFMKGFWEDSLNQVALNEEYTADEIIDFMYKTAHFMHKGFEFANPTMIRFKAMTKLIAQKMNELGVLADWSTTDKSGGAKKDTRLIPSIQSSSGMKLPLFPSNFKRKDAFAISNPITGHSFVEVTDRQIDYDRETKIVVDPKAFSQDDYDQSVKDTMSSMKEFITSDYGQEGFTHKANRKKEDVSSITARHIVVLTIQSLDNLIEARFINQFHKKYPDAYIDVIFDAIRVPAKYRKEAAKMYNEIHRNIGLNDNVIKNLGKAMAKSVELLAKDTEVMRRVADAGNMDKFENLENFARTTINKGTNLEDAYSRVFDDSIANPASAAKAKLFGGKIDSQATRKFIKESQNLK